MTNLAAVLVLSGTAAALAQAARAEETADRLQKCRSITSSGERLTCYDREAARAAPPRWQGRLSFVTEKFKIEEPTVLRFASQGAIFVLYLKDDAGEVVQNLHIGGSGEDQFQIGEPGTYFLQVNGSEGWRIWLEPPVARSNNETE